MTGAIVVAPRKKRSVEEDTSVPAIRRAIEDRDMVALNRIADAIFSKGQPQNAEKGVGHPDSEEAALKRIEDRSATRHRQAACTTGHRGHPTRTSASSRFFFSGEGDGSGQ